MSKRARYDGGSGTGVDVLVRFDDGSEQFVHVDPGHQLPTEVGDRKIPAAVRDDLLSRDDWSEVSQASPTSKSDEKE